MGKDRRPAELPIFRQNAFIPAAGGVPSDFHFNLQQSLSLNFLSRERGPIPPKARQILLSVHSLLLSGVEEVQGPVQQEEVVEKEGF